MIPKTITLKRWQYLGVCPLVLFITFYIGGYISTTIRQSYEKEFRFERQSKFMTELCPQLQLDPDKCKSEASYFTY